MRVFEASRDQADPAFGSRAGSQCMSNCFAFLHAAFLEDGRSLCERDALDAVLEDGMRLDKLTDATLREASGGTTPPHPYRLGTEIPHVITTWRGTTAHLLSRPAAGTAVTQTLDGFVCPGIFDFLRSAQRKPFPAHVIITVGAHTRAMLFGDPTVTPGSPSSQPVILVFDPHATDRSPRAAVYACESLHEVVDVLSFFGAMVGDFYYDATFVYFVRCADPNEAATIGDDRLHQAIVEAYRDPDIDVPTSRLISTPVDGPPTPMPLSLPSPVLDPAHTPEDERPIPRPNSKSTPVDAPSALRPGSAPMTPVDEAPMSRPSPMPPTPVNGPPTPMPPTPADEPPSPMWTTPVDGPPTPRPSAMSTTPVDGPPTPMPSSMSTTPVEGPATPMPSSMSTTPVDGPATPMPSSMSTTPVDGPATPMPHPLLTPLDVPRTPMPHPLLTPLDVPRTPMPHPLLTPLDVPRTPMPHPLLTPLDVPPTPMPPALPSPIPDPIPIFTPTPVPFHPTQRWPVHPSSGVLTPTPPPVFPDDSSGWRPDSPPPPGPRFSTPSRVWIPLPPPGPGRAMFPTDGDHVPDRIYLTTTHPTEDTQEPSSTRILWPSTPTHPGAPPDDETWPSASDDADSEDDLASDTPPRAAPSSRKRRASAPADWSTTASETDEPTAAERGRRERRFRSRRRRLADAERLKQILAEDALAVAAFSQAAPASENPRTIEAAWLLVHDGAPAVRDLLRDAGRQWFASLADAYVVRNPARELEDADRAEDHLRDLLGLAPDIDVAVEAIRAAGFSALRLWRRLAPRLDLLQPAEELAVAKTVTVLRAAAENDAERVELWLHDLAEALPAAENAAPATVERALDDFVRERPLAMSIPGPELCLDRATARRLVDPLRERRQQLRRDAQTRERTYRRLLDAVTKLGVATDAVAVLEKSDPRGLEAERLERLQSLARAHAERALARIRREIHESLHRELNRLLDGHLPEETISRLTDETAQARDEVHSLVTARLLPEDAHQPLNRLYDELRYMHTGQELVDVPLSQEVRTLRKQYEAGRARRDAAEARTRELLAQIEDMAVDGTSSSSSSSSSSSPPSPMDTTSAGLLLTQADELMSVDGGDSDAAPLSSDDDAWVRRRSRAARKARAAAGPSATESEDQKARDFLARLAPGSEPPTQAEVQATRALTAVLAFDAPRRDDLVRTLGQWLQHLFERLADYDPPKEDWHDRLRYLAERLPGHEPRRLTLLAVTATAGQLTRRVRQILAAKQSPESLEALLELLELRRGDLERVSGGDWTPALRGLRDRAGRELLRQRTAGREQAWEARVKTADVDSPEALTRLLAEAPTTAAAERAEPGLRERLRRHQEAADKRHAADEQRAYETRRQKVTTDLRTLAESFASATPSLFITVDRGQTRVALAALPDADREAALHAFHTALATALGRLATGAAQARLRYATGILNGVDPTGREAPGDAAMFGDDVDETRRRHARALLEEDASLLTEETARGLHGLRRDLATLLRLRRRWRDPDVAFADSELAVPYAELTLWRRDAETVLVDARAARGRELEERRRVLRQPPPPPGETASSHDAAVKAAEAPLAPPDAFPQALRRRARELQPAPFREAATAWLARADAALQDELAELNLALRAEAARRRQVRGSHEAAWRQTATALRLQAPAELRVDATALAQDPLAVAERALQATETLPYLTAQRCATWLLELVDALTAEVDARTTSDAEASRTSPGDADRETAETTPDAVLAVLRGDRAPGAALRATLRHLRHRAESVAQFLTARLADDARAATLAAALTEVGGIVTNEDGGDRSRFVTHADGGAPGPSSIIADEELPDAAQALSELRTTLDRLEAKRIAEGESRYRRLVALAASERDRLARAEELELLRGAFFDLARALQRHRYGLDFATQLRLVTALRDRLARWQSAARSDAKAAEAVVRLPREDSPASPASLRLGVEALERFVTAQRALLERLAARQPAVSPTSDVPARAPAAEETADDAALLPDTPLRSEAYKLAAVDPGLGLYVVTDVFGERRLMTASGVHLDLLATHGNFVFAACAAHPPDPGGGGTLRGPRRVTRRYRAVTVAASIAATLQTFWSDIVRHDVRHLVGPVDEASAAALEREAARRDPAAAHQIHVLSNLKLFTYLLAIAWRETDAAEHASPTVDPAQALPVSTLDLATLVAARHPEFVYAAATAPPERALRAFLQALDRHALERTASLERNPPADPLTACRAFAFDPARWPAAAIRERLWDSPFVRQLCVGHPQARDAPTATKLFQYLLALHLLPPAVLRCTWSQFRPRYAARLPSLEALTGLVAEHFFRPFEPLEPEPAAEWQLRSGESVERRVPRRPRAAPVEAVEFAQRETVLDYVLGSYVFGIPLTCGAHGGDVAGGRRRVVIRHLENVPGDPDFARVLRARDLRFADLGWADTIRNPSERAWFSLQEDRLRHHLTHPPPDRESDDPRCAAPLVLYDATSNYVLAVVRPPAADRSEEPAEGGACLQPPPPPTQLWLRGEAFATPPLTLPDDLPPADLGVVPQDVNFLTRQPAAADCFPPAPADRTPGDTSPGLFAQQPVSRPLPRDAITTVAPEAASDSFLTHPIQALSAAIRAAVRILQETRTRLLDLECSLADALRRLRILYLH